MHEAGARDRREARAVAAGAVGAVEAAARRWRAGCARVRELTRRRVRGVVGVGAAVAAKNPFFY